MATQARPIHVPAGLPLDEATRPELIETGRANVQNRNVRMVETGALEKRLGFDAMTIDRIDGTTRASGRRLFSHSGVPCVIDADGNLDQHSTNLDEWSSVGPIPEAVYSLRNLPSPTSDAGLSDIAFVNGMIAVLYAKGEDAAALGLVIDSTDGSVISELTLLGTSPGDRGFGHGLGAIKGRYFIAVTTAAAEHDLNAYYFDTQSVASGWVHIATIETDLGSPFASVCAIDDRLIVAYGVGSGDNRLVIKAVDETGVIDSTTVLTAGNAIALADVDGSSADVIWVAYKYSDFIRVTARSPTALATVVGAVATIETIDPSGAMLYSLRVCAGDTHNAQLWFMYERTDNAAQSRARGITIVSGTVAQGRDGTASLSYGAVYTSVIISSRPFYRDGKYLAFVASGCIDPEDANANSQGTCFLAEWTVTPTSKRLRPAVNVEPNLSNRLQVWSKPTRVSDTKWLYGRQFLKSGAPGTASASYGANLVEIDFASRDMWQTIDHHGVTIVSGGVVGVWDGADFTELGFLVRPLAPVVNIITPGDPGYLNGSYRYAMIFTDVDASGAIVLSGVSATTLVSLTNQTTTIAPQSPGVTYRTRLLGSTSGASQARVRCAVYRTIAGGEPPYYLVGVVPQSSNLADDISDADLQTRQKLYAPNLPGAVGEALDRRAPSQLLYPVSYAGMLVGAKGSSLFWSGQEVYGEATWFSPVFELPISGGGDITGLVVQDGAIVIFKRDRIFVVAGQSPSDNGAQGGLGEPRLVSSEWGCIDSNSIVATQLGVFFQSERGIEIFSRAQSVEWIGEPVVDTLEGYPVVTSAVVDARNGLVRFALATSVTSGVVDAPSDADDGPGVDLSGGGREVVFDLRAKMWVSVDVRESLEASQHASYVDADGRRYAWLGTDGVVHFERDFGSDKECRDGDAWVTSQYTPAPWRYGLQQEQRVFELMPLYQRMSSAGITVEVAEDYGAFTDSKTWTSSFLDARPDATRIALRSKETPGFAVQVSLSDAAPDEDPGTDSGRGITWVGISADIGPKQGTTRGTPVINDEMRR